MTKTEFRKRYRQLLKDSVRALRNFGEYAVRHGLVDLNSEGEWTEPKNVLVAAMEREAGPAGHGPSSLLSPANNRKIRKRVAQLRSEVPSPAPGPKLKV
jgi:hypothetical protein